MAYIFSLLVLFLFSDSSFAAEPGVIDLAGWIKNENGTYTKAFNDPAGSSRVTLSSAPKGLSVTSTALVQTTKGITAMDIVKTANVNTARLGSAMVGLAKKAGPVGLTLTAATLVCELTNICNQAGSWFTTQVETLPNPDTDLWICSHSTTMQGTINQCKANYYACNSPNRLCSEDAVVEGGYGYKFKMSQKSDGFVNGYADMYRLTKWVPSPTGTPTPTTDTDWNNAAPKLNDDRVTPHLIEADEPLPTDGVPTLTPDQKKRLGLDSVPTKDSSGNITGREDTTTEIEAVDAGTSDNPGRVIIKETKTTVKYDNSNTQISSTTNTSYTSQPQPDQKQQSFEIKFDEVPAAELPVHNVQATFNSTSWGNGTCPPDIPIDISYYPVNLVIPTAPICDTAEKINPFVLLLASIAGIYIVSGVRSTEPK